jgi:secreted PhoX family phosphatase
VGKKDLYVAPMLGRAAWENVTALENFRSDKVVLLIGDDTTGAPLWLYIGKKNGKPGQGYEPSKFLKRNGLGLGHLYAWVADNGDAHPDQFHATGESRKGKFKKVTHFDPSMAGESGWDSMGFAHYATQLAAAKALGAFVFSRPEDLCTNPKDGTQAFFASTGNDSFSSSDKWGTSYIVDVQDLDEHLDRKLENIDCIEAKLRIVYDGDDAGAGQFAGPDYGLRSPDNCEWATDGNIYVCEDRSYDGFGETSGIEASVWCIDPCSGKLTRILEVDRSAVPMGQSDPSPNDIGNWESSGVLDVTRLFKHKKGETLLILDVQAHSLRDGLVASLNLAQGGQLLLASKMNKKVKDWDRDCDDDDDDDNKGTDKGKGKDK